MMEIMMEYTYMVTKNPRINVTFEDKISALLGELATRESRSISSLVRELTLEALERREDKLLSQLGDELDNKSSKTYSHEDAWK